MKTTAALSFALAGTAVAAGAADQVNSVLNDINTAVKAFGSTISGFSGDVAPLNSAASKIEQITKEGASKIAGGAELTLTDAVSITTNVQGLQGNLETTLSDLEKLGPALAKAGNCGTVKSQLASQGSAANDLADAITGKAPAETKSIAKQLGGKISESIKSTSSKFDTICAGASSGPSSAPSSGSSGAQQPAAGGHSGHSDSSMPPPAAGGAAPAPASGPAAAAPKPASSTTGKGSTTSTIPKPATFTGSASTLNAYRALGLGAVAAFFAL